jgi:hypothetical protein
MSDRAKLRVVEPSHISRVLDLREIETCWKPKP